MSVLREYAAGLGQPSFDDDPAGLARFDEVMGPDGTLRASWRGLAELAVNLTPADLHRVDADVRRMLSDDGVTYSRPGAPSGPWRLDPMPLVIDAPTWTRLEIGLAQRAELLNAVLADLYGEQRLLAEGVLPPAVVLGHAGFARVVARAGAVEPRPLVLMATDLGRDATGRWRALADRTQAPSGLGYAVENRRVLSRVLPELYREAGLHRMEPFLSALRSALLQSAPGDLADPRVVVLSPGTQSETAYDQAVVASSTGFPLVQGSDLVVRDGWVQMRVVGRLERVDVILRRVDASYADPLELRGDSRLGVAGLTEAVRRGRVRVVNGLGAGVLENPALLPHLPALSQRLLGEPLRLASLDTWWCGEPEGLERVLDDLDDLVVRTLDGVDEPAADLSRSALVDLVLAAPHRYVGQERLPLSQAPSWRPGGGGVVARPLTLRTFTLRYGSTYRPLAGGLASLVEGRRPVGSKDVWVLKADPTDADQGLVDVMPMVSARASTGTVPRILEDLYWTGRYAERAEDLLRMVIVAHALAEDFRFRPRTTGGAGLEVMIGALTRLVGPLGGPPDDLDAGFRSLLLDASRDGSVAQSLERLREALAGVRDQLSGDIWRVFGVTERAATALEGSPYSPQIADTAGRMLTGVLALQGATSSMIRDAGWHMMAVGRYLERALQVSHLLAGTTTVRRGIDVDREVLGSVLTAAESAVTHRRRYRGSVRTGGVLELVLMDAVNPRSLSFALARVSEHLEALPGSTGSTRPERLVDDLRAQVATTDVAALVAIGGVGRPHLASFLDHAIASLERITTAVADLHHTTGPAPRPLLSMPLVESFATATATATATAPPARPGSAGSGRGAR